MEDTSFSLGYHVRHTALPAPGSDEQLRTLTSRIVAQRLDRTKPLWEMWLVEGLASGGYAVIAKTHHAMIDGVAGVDLLTVLFDVTRETSTPVEPETFSPQPTPDALALLALGARGGLRTLVALGTRGVGLALRPREGLRALAETAAALAETALPLVNGAPPTPLNVKPGPHRTLAAGAARLRPRVGAPGRRARQPRQRDHGDDGAAAGGRDRPGRAARRCAGEHAQPQGQQAG